MELPLSANNLITHTKPRPQLPPIRRENRFEGANNKNTREEDMKILMKMMEPKGNGKLTMEKYIENTELQREFNDKWKPKNANKTLQEALFEVYIQRNINIEDKIDQI